IDLAELAGTTRLLFVGVAVVDCLGNRLAIGNLRFAHVQLDTVGTLEDVDLDIQVQFAHALENGFAGILVGFHLEGRIFCHQLADRDTHFLNAGLVFRCNSNGDYRLGEDHGFKGARMVRVAQRMTGLHVLHADHSDDVAGLGIGQFGTLVGVHLHHTADALGLAGKGVQDGVAFAELARVQTQEGQGAVTVIHDLERQRAERFVRRNNRFLAGRCAGFIGQVLRLDFGRARQVIGNAIQNQLHALVLERGATEGREEVELAGAFTDAALEVFNGRLLAFHVRHHELIVLLYSGFNQLLAILRGLLFKVVRNIGNAEILRLPRIVPYISFLGEYIYYAYKAVLRADRQGHDQGLGGQHLFNLLYNAEKISANAVKLVD